MTRTYGIALALLTLTALGCDAGFEVDTRSDAIVGGAPTSGDPAVALIVITDDQGTPVGRCSGTLIAPKAVLTAAHCIVPDHFAWVYFGTKWVEGDPGMIYEGWAAEWYYPSAYDGTVTNRYDIAILILDNPAPIAPMPIMRKPITSSMLGQPVHLVGWGITSGSAADSGVKRAGESSLIELDDTHLQIGDSTVSICSGDSGGPAFMTIDGVKTVVGVSSYADVDCAEYGVDVRVDANLAFIDAVLGADDGGPTDDGTDDTDDPQLGGFRASCSGGGDCASGLCVDDGNGSGWCTMACTSDNQCGSGYACVEANPDLSVCYPGDEDDGDGFKKGDGGVPFGCSAANDGDTGSLASFLIVLALATLARRRGRLA